ncbi:hypothetical protein CGZ91_09210 [Parenemella sanctibonifatiensis]|uniref:MFS transporter n=1 Tax=Parenemella sanctibonifatiensis TaxID=2016505 RepID=A0A255EFM5_9ACTN|nr:hypothetical protein CGZ91_09210 [Parenemella sanctibonifatiensis]
MQLVSRLLWLAVRVTAAVKPIRRPERVIFAAGDIFAGGGSSLLAVMYLIFLTDVVHIQPWLAGTAIFVAKLWDAVNDPLMGALSDRIRTRFGRRRPFIFAGSLLLVPVMALLWLPWVPVDGQVAMAIWAALSLIVYNSVQTMLAVPYASFSTEIATSYAERNKVNTLRLLFSSVSSAVSTLAASALFGAYRSGGMPLTEWYAITVLGFGLVYATPMLVLAIVCRERTPVPETNPKLTPRTFVQPLQTPIFRRLLGMYIAQALAWDVVSATILYYTLYVLPGSNSQVFLGTFIAVNVIAYPIVSQLVKRIDKRRIYATLIPLAMVGIIGVAFYPADWPMAGAYAIGAAVAIGMAGAQLMPWVMFPDVLDAAQLQNGRRDAGSYGALMTFLRGIGSAIVVWLIGQVLSATGYLTPEGNEVIAQPESVQWGIRWVMFVGVAGFMAAGWWLSRKYSLGLTEALAQQQELERRAAADDTVSAPSEA